MGEGEKREDKDLDETNDLAYIKIWSQNVLHFMHNITSLPVLIRVVCTYTLF